MTTSPIRPLALERLVYFSDAVFAIAITLLVLDIRVPEIERAAAPAELGRHLLALLPQVIGFVVSFMVIGLYWEAHHRMFGFIKSCTRTLIWLNMAELCLIAFLPLPTAVLGRYAFVPLAVVCYAGTVIAVGLARTAIWRYASSGRRLLDADTSPEEIRVGMWRGILPPAIFALSLPLTLVAPTLAMVSWILIVPALRIVDARIQPN